MSIQSSIRLMSAVLACVFMSGCDQADDTQSQLASRQVEGELIYRQNCKVCHAQAINGAPIPGNKKMWEARAAQGQEVLVEHAVNGYGLMPAKGGKDHLTTEQIRLVVEYYLSQL